MTVIHRYPEKLAVVKLGAGAEVPSWAESSSVFSVTATATETSVVCAGRDVPKKVVAVRGLTGFAVRDAGEPTTPGVLVDLLAPVAELGHGVFVVTTYDTLWVLVPSTGADDVQEAWRRRGTAVEAAVPAS